MSTLFIYHSSQDDGFVRGLQQALGDLRHGVLIDSRELRGGGHARIHVAPRGTTAAEIGETIRSQTWTSADGGRFECRRDIPFGDNWNGEHYEPA